MEDKRILKTKRNLKQTLASLLCHKPLESITVTELCESASTSRITFYTHYDDKYALADDMVSDMVDAALKDFDRLQSTTNPENNPVTSAQNVLEAVLNLFVRNQKVFNHASREESPYLFKKLYENLQRNVQAQAQKICQSLPTRFDLKRVAVFICDGMWGYIVESRKQNCSFETIRKEARELLNRLLGTTMTLQHA
ncbi:MAG: TetR/AcrR family transcriptional regulator [Clostridia bacterium]|nr:TetR/AcrR family transcriptional regulator [Clostridia bacterium]